MWRITQQLTYAQQMMTVMTRLIMIDLCKIIRMIQKNCSYDPHMNYCVNWTQYFGIRSTLEGRIRYCQERGIDVGLLYLGLGKGSVEDTRLARSIVCPSRANMRRRMMTVQ